MKKRRFPTLPLFAAAAAVAALAAFLLPAAWAHRETDAVTPSTLREAISIGELSTAEFAYDGIAEKYDDERPGEAECHISYHATVRVGVPLEDVTFLIDDERRTVTPILPRISIQVVSLDEDKLGYIPANPDLPLKEILRLCKEDATDEVSRSAQLYTSARENLRSAMEALLAPLLDEAGYAISWQEGEA